MQVNSVFPGDDVVPEAVMVYDQTIKIAAAATDIFPWLQQIGKGRGGWYLKSSWEQMLPVSWRAARSINPDWQHLKPGDRIEDYGFNEAEDYFIVDSIQAPEYIVFRSERYGCSFSWALLLHESRLSNHPETTLHLRFRGKIEATGVKRFCIVRGGGFMDWLTTTPMLAGIKERAEREKGD